MANVTINDLTARTSLAADDVFEVDNTSSADDTEKVAFSLIGMEIVHRDTDATHTFVVGEHYISNISAWSNAGAGRVWTLPTTHKVGERCAVTLETGDDAEHLQVNTGVGNTCIFKDEVVSASTEITRLFITGETLIFKSVTANSIWQLEYDGRIPCVGKMDFTGTGTNQFADSAWTNALWDGATYNVGDICDTTNNQLTLRRAGRYHCSARLHTGTDIGDRKLMIVRITDDTAGPNYIGRSSQFGTSWAGTAGAAGHASGTFVVARGWAAGANEIKAAAWQTSGSATDQSNSSPNCYLEAVEII